jgi:hypothetical protein
MSGDFWSTRSRAGVPSGRPARRRSASSVLVIACLLVLTGCRMDLVAEAVVDPGGGGRVAIATGFDTELLDQLDDLGIDPTAELEAVAASTAGWETVRRTRDDGGLEVVATRAVDDGDAIGDVFRELSAGLSETDPALVIDIGVATDDDGGTQVSGSAALRPPATAGVSLDGVEVGPATQELAALVADAVDAQLRIRFPGNVQRHDGDRLDGRTVTWDLPSGAQVPVDATASPPSLWARLGARWSDQPAVALTVAVALVFLLVGGGLFLRRSRSEAASD